MVEVEVRQEEVDPADAAAGEIEVTAFPLFAQTDDFVGVVVIFWRT